MSVCAPFLSAAMLAEGRVFDRHFTTVYRWAKSGRFPEPDLSIGGTAFWMEATIRDWAAERKLTIDEDAFTQICRSQLVD